MNPIRKGRALTLILTHSGSSEVLKSAIDKARIGDREKMEAIRRLRHFNVKVKNWILKRVQNDSLVMPNQVLNSIQDLRFRHLV